LSSCFFSCRLFKRGLAGGGFRARLFLFSAGQWIVPTRILKDWFGFRFSLFRQKLHFFQGLERALRFRINYIEITLLGYLNNFGLHQGLTRFAHLIEDLFIHLQRGAHRVADLNVILNRRLGVLFKKMNLFARFRHQALSFLNVERRHA
jgi:hypothetical protein